MESFLFSFGFFFFSSFFLPRRSRQSFFPMRKRSKTGFPFFSPLLSPLSLGMGKLRILRCFVERDTKTSSPFFQWPSFPPLFPPSNCKDAFFQPGFTALSAFPRCCSFLPAHSSACVPLTSTLEHLRMPNFFFSSSLPPWIAPLFSPTKGMEQGFRQRRVEAQLLFSSSFSKLFSFRVKELSGGIPFFPFSTLFIPSLMKLA